MKTNGSVFAIFVSQLLILACNQTRSPQEIKEKTAEATSEAKSDAQAVAQGLREGWNRDHPLNLNSASKADLSSLPGVTEVEADRIIGGRPYNDPDQLVTRRIMSQGEYDKISDRVTAK
jgi:competence protein ComEA